MNKIVKRYISLVLAVLMLAGQFPVSARAAEGGFGIATANYTVEHWKQNSDGTYKLDSTTPERGIVGQLTSATAKSYTDKKGETTHLAAPFDQQRIAADESTVIKIYYDEVVYLSYYTSNSNNGAVGMILFAKVAYRKGAIAEVLDANLKGNGSRSFAGWVSNSTYDNNNVQKNNGFIQTDLEEVRKSHDYYAPHDLIQMNTDVTLYAIYFRDILGIYTVTYTDGAGNTIFNPQNHTVHADGNQATPPFSFPTGFNS